MVYAGREDIVGFHNSGDFDTDPPVNFWEDPARFGVRLPVDSDLAEHILDQLVRRDFDVSISRSQSRRSSSLSSCRMRCLRWAGAA